MLSLTKSRKAIATQLQHVNSQRFFQSIGKPGGNLVILGTGWAGFKVLGGINTNRYDVTVVSPRNYFAFTPLLASTAVGTLEFRAITEPVRDYQKDIRYHQAWCERVDLEKKQLICVPALPEKREEFTVSFDKLVIATGAYANTFGIPGVTENAYFLREIEHARKIRNRIIECFEWASEPNVKEQDVADILHFAVVGGGPTGVEFAAELHDFVTEDLARLYPSLMNKVQISVYDVAEKILGTFDGELGEYATKKFIRKGIKINTKAFISEVQKGEMVMKDGRIIPFGALVWATGVTANPLTKILSVSKDKQNRIITDDFMRVIDEKGNVIPDVYALGDCAVVNGMVNTATAQQASQKGVWLKNYLNRIAVNKEPGQPFTYHHKGSMVYFGKWEALLDLTNATDRLKGLRGHLAWLIWRSAYLTQSVSMKNKVLIPMYWLLTFLFGRDISKF